jgi:hypothetical protein
LRARRKRQARGLAAIRELQLDDIDLGNRRLTISGKTAPPAEDPRLAALPALALARDRQPAPGHQPADRQEALDPMSKAGRRVREHRDGPDHDLLHLGVIMPQPTDQRTQILVVDATQLQALRAALGDAVEHKTVSVDGWCPECESARWADRCTGHQAMLQQRAAYVALSMAMQRQVEADMAAGL